MIKKLIVVLLLVPVMASAQRRLFDYDINLPNHSDKKFHFGINAGVNKSHYNFTRHPNYLAQDSISGIESVNSTGLNLAWLVHLRLSDHFAIRTYPLNLVFTEKAFEYTLPTPSLPEGEENLMTKRIQGITMSLPVQLQFSSDRIDNFKVYMIAGGKIDYDMAANKGARNAERMFKLDKLDYGLEGGIGFHFYFPVFVLSPELKFGWGLNNVHARDPLYKYSNVVDKANARTVSLTLTVE